MLATAIRGARLPSSLRCIPLSGTPILTRQFTVSHNSRNVSSSTNNSSHSPQQQQQHQQQQHQQQQHQQQQHQQPVRQFVEGLRQKNVPLAGTNEDADSAISGFMNMFNDKESRTVAISACTKHGFVTTEAIALQGPVLCIGGQVFLWDIYKESGVVAQSLKRKQSSSSSSSSSTTGATTSHARPIFEDMDENTARDIFKVFELMSPRPEILIVGTGKVFAPLSPAVRSVVRSLGLQVDMMSTANAAATYNMLAEEGREVAAALLPLEPSTVHIVHGKQ